MKEIKKKKKIRSPNISKKFAERSNTRIKGLITTIGVLSVILLAYKYFMRKQKNTSVREVSEKIDTLAKEIPKKEQVELKKPPNKIIIARIGLVCLILLIVGYAINQKDIVFIIVDFLVRLFSLSFFLCLYFINYKLILPKFNPWRKPWILRIGGIRLLAYNRFILHVMLNWMLIAITIAISSYTIITNSNTDTSTTTFVFYATYTALVIWMTTKEYMATKQNNVKQLEAIHAIKLVLYMLIITLTIIFTFYRLFDMTQESYILNFRTHLTIEATIYAIALLIGCERILKFLDATKTDLFGDNEKIK